MTSGCLPKQTHLVLVGMAASKGERVWAILWSLTVTSCTLQKTSLAARFASRGSSIQEDSQHGWLILKALSCQEDLYSADGGNAFCQAFEIQMMSSTLCPTDGFESSHERRATEMGPTRAEGEQKGKINFSPKIDDSAEPKKTQISNHRATWL